MLHWDVCHTHTPDFVFGWVILYLVLWFLGPLLLFCEHYDSCRIHAFELRQVEWVHDVWSCYIIGIFVESKLLNWGPLSEFMMYGFIVLWNLCRIYTLGYRPVEYYFACVLIQPLFYDLRDGGVLHMSTYAWIVKWLVRSDLPFVFWWSYNHLRLGWEYACLWALIIGWACVG